MVGSARGRRKCAKRNGRRWSGVRAGSLGRASSEAGLLRPGSRPRPIGEGFTEAIRGHGAPPAGCRSKAAIRVVDVRPAPRRERIPRSGSAGDGLRWRRHPGRRPPVGGGRDDRGTSGPCRTTVRAGASGGDRRRLRIVRGVAAMLRRTRCNGDDPPRRFAARSDQALRDHGDLRAIDADVGERVVVEPR